MGSISIRNHEMGIWYFLLKGSKHFNFLFPNEGCETIAFHFYFQASGPLRQATGPPWSDAGVGIGMLRGAGDSLT